jgi:2-methylaconitate cis-trans-isomerase PrpF
VPGTGAPIRLDFIDPGGSRTTSLLPAGETISVFDEAGMGQFAVSMVDAGNPCVFVEAASLGVDGHASPEQLDDDPVLAERMEAIRQRASVAMGLASDLLGAARTRSILKVALVSETKDTRTMDGSLLLASEADLTVRMSSMGRFHRAVPVTGALCVAAGSSVPGTLLWRLSGGVAARSGHLRVGHPSGTVDVAATIATDQDGEVLIQSAAIYRTARRLFEGRV